MRTPLPSTSSPLSSTPGTTSSRRCGGRRAARPVEHGTELTLPQFGILRPLDAASTGVPIGELADRAEIAAPTASRMIDALEREGMIERQRSETDRRVTTITMTAKGREMFAAKQALIETRRDEMFRSLSAEERDHAHAPAEADGRPDGGALSAAATAPDPSPSTGVEHYNVTLGVLLTGALAYALSQTMIAPALPEIQNDLGTTTTLVTLGAHRLPARPPRSRRRSSAGSATCSARSGCSSSRSIIFAARLAVCAALALASALLIAGRVDPGHRRCGLPALVRDHPRRVPARAGRHRHRPDLRDRSASAAAPAWCSRPDRRPPRLPLDLLVPA